MSPRPKQTVGAVLNRQARISLLIAEFPRFLRVFEQNPPFKRWGQLEHHVDTIQRRRELGSATKAVNDDQFLAGLYKTLQAWGIGVRASKLKPLGAFSDALRAKSSEIADLDNLSIDDPTLNVKAVTEKLWRLIDTLDIVANKTRIVPGSKALHHLLPELVVPVDRAYTQKFFQWQTPTFQDRQASCFAQAFAAFAEIARRVNPVQYTTGGWNSSRTKVIDNAIVGMLCEEGEISNLASAGGETVMSHADEVRAYCARHYVQSARANGKREISIRAGDVHAAMGYKNRFPLVCSAIGASVFSESNGLRRLAVEGPLNGANTVFRFLLT